MTENVLNDGKMGRTVEVNAERLEMLKVIERIVGQTDRRIAGAFWSTLVRQVDVGNVAAWKYNMIYLSKLLVPYSNPTYFHRKVLCLSFPTYFFHLEVLCLSLLDSTFLIQSANQTISLPLFYLNYFRVRYFSTHPLMTFQCFKIKMQFIKYFRH
jgi:hypothetical protein